MTGAGGVERVVTGPRGRFGLMVTTGSTSFRAGEIGVDSRGFCTGVTGSGEWNVRCGGEPPAVVSATAVIAVSCTERRVARSNQTSAPRARLYSPHRATVSVCATCGLLRTYRRAHRSPTLEPIEFERSRLSGLTLKFES